MQNFVVKVSTKFEPNALGFLWEPFGSPLGAFWEWIVGYHYFEPRTYDVITAQGKEVYITTTADQMQMTGMGVRNGTRYRWYVRFKSEIRTHIVRDMLFNWRTNTGLSHDCRGG